MLSTRLDISVDHDPPAIESPRSSKRARTSPATSGIEDVQCAYGATQDSSVQHGRGCPVDMDKFCHNRMSSINNCEHVFEHLDDSKHDSCGFILSVSPKPRPLGSHLSTSSLNRLEGFERGVRETVKPPTPLVAPKTSLHTLRSSPGIGCSVYDSDVHSSKSESSNPRGHMIDRISSCPKPIRNVQDPIYLPKNIPGDQVALVTDLETINAALDAKEAINVSRDANMSSLSNDDDYEDTMSGLLDDDFEKWYLGVESVCCNTNDTRIPFSTLRDCEVTALTDDIEFDDDTLDVGLFDEVMFDEIFNENDIAEMDRITKAVEEETKGVGEKVNVLWNEITSDARLPVRQQTPAAADTQDLLSISTYSTAPVTKNDIRKPIVRKPTHNQVKDRSPVLGLTASTVLRTCFRVGEAINSGCQAVRQGRHVVIELYARVTSTWREDGSVKQHFVFADLYHDNPPFIDGVHETWKGLAEWETETARFLAVQDSDDGRSMCRVLGSMRRKDKSKWEFLIQNIRVTGWDEVEYVAGIYS